MTSYPALTHVVVVLLLPVLGERVHVGVAEEGAVAGHRAGGGRRPGGARRATVQRQDVLQELIRLGHKLTILKHMFH